MNNVVTEQLRGFEIRFKTKPGVFSSKGLDLGSRLLIESMEVKDGTLIADLGAGTGVVGFVAAKLNPSGHVHLLDDHLRSIELAKENTDSNKLKNLEVYLSDLFSAVRERTYHQIFSNPPQQLGNEFLEEIVKESYKHLKPQGELWIVVKKNVGKVMKRYLEEVFKNSKIISHGREHILLKAVHE